MSKLDRIKHIVKDTNEEISQEVYEAILKEDRINKFKKLERKFKNNTITLEEIKELIKYKFNPKSDSIFIKYKSFFKVNMCKEKPEEISHSEYGKFFSMLNFLSYENKMKYPNGRVLKRQIISDKLGFKNLRGFNSLIKKLSTHKMLGESEIGGINYLIINPVYAQRNMNVDPTIFKLFKDDIIPFLNEYQIKLLELEDYDIELSSVVAIESVQKKV